MQFKCLKKHEQNQKINYTEQNMNPASLIIGVMDNTYLN